MRRVQKNPPGWKNCGKSCRICPYTIENTETVTGLASGFKHTIKQAVTCTSENVIYYWKCTKKNCDVYPECEYIGKTKRKFKDRCDKRPKRTREPTQGSIYLFKLTSNIV